MATKTPAEKAAEKAAKEAKALLKAQTEQFDGTDFTLTEKDLTDFAQFGEAGLEVGAVIKGADFPEEVKEHYLEGFIAALPVPATETSTPAQVAEEPAKDWVGGHTV